MILVNGDSITYGQGLTDLLKSWPYLIFDNCKNLAEPGSSNFSIYRRTLEELLIKEYSHIIIGWSGLYRLEIADTASKPKTIHPLMAKTNLEKELSLNYLGQYWYFKNFLMVVYQLMLVAKHKKSKLFCVNFGNDVADAYLQTKNYKSFKKMFDLELYNDTEIRHEFIITHKLILATKHTWIIPPEIDLKQIYIKPNHIIAANDFHPNFEGHKLIAQQINKNIKL